MQIGHEQTIEINAALPLYVSRSHCSHL